MSTSPRRRRQLLTALMLAATSAMLAPAARSAGFPDRPVTLVVPFAAGGGTDSIARDLARTLSERLGQPVVVENRGGGGGAIGAGYVAGARADGHTLLFATSTFVTNAAAGMASTYDVRESFEPVAMLGRGPLLVVAAKNLGLRSVAQLRELAGKPDAGLNFCSAGNGSINHLAGELFKQQAGVDMTHVPYKGSGPATVDLLAGRVQVFFATVPTMLSQVRDGRVDLLAVTGRQRSPLFPETPTMAEAGLPDFDITTWWGILAPKGTPPEIVEQLNREINAAAGAKLVHERLVHEGADTLSGSPADFAQALAAELDMWRGVVKRSGMTLD
ncbi:tripartite tricarboxylate transporter substrate binding protein [Bordetella sp. 2513F-2]